MTNKKYHDMAGDLITFRRERKICLGRSARARFCRCIILIIFIGSPFSASGMSLGLATC